MPVGVDVNRWLLKPQAKPALFAAALLPFAWLLYGAIANTLGANPAEALIRSTGDWTLRFLCLTLAVTPLRLVLPWKYGFKGAKSLVKIRLVEKQPVSSWERANASEYGFYSNVNPTVDHPRWSQATERRIGEEGGLFARRRPTLMFNGYEPQVGQLYAGMDLKKNY